MRAGDLTSKMKHMLAEGFTIQALLKPSWINVETGCLMAAEEVSSGFGSLLGCRVGREGGFCLRGFSVVDASLGFGRVCGLTVRQAYASFGGYRTARSAILLEVREGCMMRGVYCANCVSIKTY